MTTRPETGFRWILAGVLLIALATLAYEVLLTRIFSVTLWYHFGFLAISMALLGTAASAVLCFLYPERLAREGHQRVLAIGAVSFAVLAALAVGFHISVALPNYSETFRFYGIFAAQLTLLFLSFFASGLCISIALYRYSEEVGTVYFYDLVGASIGCLTVIPVMYHWSAPSLIFAVSAIGCLAALAFAFAAGASAGVRASLAAAVLGCLVLAGLNDSLGLLRIRLVKSYASNDFQHQEPETFFEKWSPISRVAVLGPGAPFKPKEMLKVTNDAGAPTLMLAFDGDYSKIQHLKDDPVQAAHHLKKDASVLVIGTGGGIDVLTALTFEQAKVTAVEINPVMGDLVTDHYADYTGRIFEDPRVALHIQEGRNFVAGTDEKFDLIHFMMIDSWGAGAAAGAYVFSENSLYTTEAVGDYLAHLNPDGIVSMTRFYKWAEGLRLTNLFADHLERSGIEDPENRIVVLKKTKRTFHPAVTVLLKKGRFSEQEVAILRDLTTRGEAEIIYAPHLAESDLSQAPGDRLYREVIDPAAHGTTREDLIAGHSWNLAPPTDDHPFFFFTRHLADAFDVNPKEHAARRVAIPLLYGMVVVFGTIGIVTVFLPLYLRARGEIREAPHRFPSLLYFAMLGAGFMLIEISLIQRLTIFLGHPTWSFVVVLATLLFTSGVGSLFSARWPDGDPKVLSRVLIAILVLMGFYTFVMYDQFIALMWLGKTSRIGVAVAVMAPAGFLMGMCFPMGVQIVRRFHESLVPWGWGVNGAFSVFASILSILVAIAVGFKAGLVLGMLCYAVALLIVRSWAPAPAADPSA